MSGLSFFVIRVFLSFFRAVIVIRRVVETWRLGGGGSITLGFLFLDFFNM